MTRSTDSLSDGPAIGGRPPRELLINQPRWSGLAPEWSEVMTRVLIGTSGWHYDSWRGPFFPRELRLKDQLQYYASQFCTAELNGVCYRSQTIEGVRTWRTQTGKDFVFAWKASKYITHWK